MARRIESDCVDCGLPCTHICQHYGMTTTYFSCDRCGDDADVLYEIEDKELCLDCAADAIRDEFVEDNWDEIKEVFRDDISDYLEGCRIKED